MKLSYITKLFFLTGPTLLGHIIANRDYTSTMLPNEAFLNRIIADETTTIIQQLEIDYDHFEVSVSIIDSMNSQLITRYLVVCHFRGY